jgi:hypothetical protein
MEEMMTHDIEGLITKALANKTLVPKAIYNIVIDYSLLNIALDKLFKPDVLTMASFDDVEACRTLLHNSAHKGICKNLLGFGLPILENNNFEHIFISTVMLWLESSISNHNYITLVELEDEETLMAINNAILNILNDIRKQLLTLDPDMFDVTDYFTYNSHEYISINDYVMFKSIRNKVLCILRF